ncbi:MAG: glutathione S-transferase [Verrucomicrobiae bacterium]|nr:glutathione S-transferase [Verrucomicrobiae bacterium]
MISLYQLAWSPYCLIQRRILEFGRIPFKTVEVSAGDRKRLWQLTRARYYEVPVLKHGRQVVFETGPDSQVIAKYLDNRFALDLFPRECEGVQDILWRYFENDVEAVGFKLNDIYWREFVPKADHCGFVRHKERRFGRGCLEEWRGQHPQLLARLEVLLNPAEKMLAARPFLLASRPVFADFCLFGILANFLFTGHYELPAAMAHLRDWYGRMRSLRQSSSA